MSKRLYLVSCTILVIVCFMSFIAYAAETKTGNIRQIPNMTVNEQALVKSRINSLKTDMDILDSKLNAMLKMKPAERKKAWIDLRAQIERVNKSSLEMKKRNATVKGKRLNKADWAPTSNQLNQTKLKLEALLKKYEALAKNETADNVRKLDAMRDDIKTKRSEVESKFKAGEQARNSDYNVLLSIVKTINEELGVFNKAMM